MPGIPLGYSEIETIKSDAKPHRTPKALGAKNANAFLCCVSTRKGLLSALKNSGLRTLRRYVCVSATTKINITLMRSFVFTSLLMLALLVPQQSAPAAPANDPIANLDAFITRALKEYQVPGAAVAVVRDGKPVLLKGYGVRDVTKSGCGRRKYDFSIGVSHENINRCGRRDSCRRGQARLGHTDL